MYDINIDVDVVAYEGLQSYRRRGTALNSFFKLKILFFGQFAVDVDELALICNPARAQLFK